MSPSPTTKYPKRVPELLMSIAFAPLLLAAFLPVGSAQAVTARASVGATVIAPVSVTSRLADLPVTFSVSGGSVRLMLPLAGPPPLVSSLSPLRDAADVVVQVSSEGGTTSLGAATAADLRGEFAISLSAPMPLNDGGYRVTMAFN